MSTKLPDPCNDRAALLTRLLTGAALEAMTNKGSIPNAKSGSVPKVPNWKEWSSAPEVRVWQACALSLNIDPHSMTKEILPRLGSGPFFEAKSFPSGDVKAEFERRQNALFHNLSNRNFFSPSRPNQGTQPGNCTVFLSQFAAWAVLEVNWEDMPHEFKVMAQSRKPAAVISETRNAAPPLSSVAVLPVSTPQPAPASAPVTPTAALPVPTPPTTGVTKPANNWDEHGKQRLLSESREAGMTQEKLAERYGVTRQRIGALLKEATPKKQDAFSAFARGNSKK